MLVRAIIDVNGATHSGGAEEAILWIARLRADDVSDDDRERFIEWFADPRHRHEFDTVFALWERLAGLRHLH